MSARDTLVPGLPARNRRRAVRTMERGMTLVEMMISIVLGMIIVGAAIGIFVANQQTYRATGSLSRVQENVRTTFELMAREIRETAGVSCDARNLLPANMLAGTAPWWSNLSNGVRGYDNGGLAGSLAGTDAIELVSGTTSVVHTINQMASSAADIQTTTSDHGLGAGDILVICDFECASVFQHTGQPDGTVTTEVKHESGTTEVPGNRAANLECDSLHPVPHTYAADSLLTKMKASRWYVADNGDGTSSLYRISVDKGVEGAGQEMVEGVTDMELFYLVAGGTAYVNAASVGTNWPNVRAVRIELTFQGEETFDGGSRIERQLSHTVNLRNRTLL